MQRVAVINVVGLTPSLIGPHTPAIKALADQSILQAVKPVVPALTCSAQATYLTGTLPSQHGIVGNGWYDRDLCEVQFWKQSNHLVQQSKLWESLRSDQAPQLTCAKLFWWYNMYSSADYSITPRPIYPADGRKFFDIYTAPASIRNEIKEDLGEFPFPTFWGPAAGQSTPQGPPDAASRWIAESAKWIENHYHPTLNLVYLPHLDYNLQRLGPQHPEIPADLRRIDAIVGELIEFFEKRSIKTLILSEYGITPVSQSIYLNRVFREKKWITVRDELGLEILDPGASRVFAVCDHQVAHIYLNEPSLASQVRSTVESLPGVAQVLGPSEKRALGLDHPRAGDLVALSTEQAWFTYYYWMEDAKAPDFARCVDIHRKPGYDPVELFIDPQLHWPRMKIAWRLLQKKLGLRMLMDLIPLDASLVRGSHGVIPASENDYPLLIHPGPASTPQKPIPATQVFETIKSHLLDPVP